MASRIAAAVRQASNINRISSQPSSSSSRFIQRRGFAGAADHHGPAKVNCWSEPTNPSNWKEEHFVIVSLTGWALAIGGGYKLVTGGKGDKVEKAAEATH